MTNEEAINILKSKIDGSVDTSYEWVEAIRLAICALNGKENLEKKNEFLVDKFEDLIALKTRVAILESQMSELVRQTSNENERLQDKNEDIDIPKMCIECHSQSYYNGFDAGYDLGKGDAQTRIKADEERSYGKWITRTEDNGASYHFYCSCCDREVTQITDYCPYCGAYMYMGRRQRNDK